ncbi:purine-uracil permease NCS1-like [Magnolia sinica]|uniref:purine-uracil permease NCS1-like n=1 Tax=Magnolia sinica TaxID=86752 RepID=UPI002658DB37|nr:purine-uracil permease NCS1-like [Magnolia sinica]
MAATPASGPRSESNTHISDDLRPTPKEQRTVSSWEMAGLWVSLVVSVPNYYVAGSLVDLGMSWWQGITTIVAANAIITICLILTGHPGTRYGIPFPILSRSAFGISGAHVATLLRSLVACGWFSIESWIGGQAIFLLLPSSLKRSSSFAHTISWLGTSPLEFTCFIFFWLAQLAFIWKGIAGIRSFEKYSAPILVILTLALLVWAYINAGGFGNMLSLPSRLTPYQFWSIFFPCLTANISSWSTLALNIPDFTRYAKTQADQMLGQVGLPIFMGVFAFVGLAITSSTEVIFGHMIPNPVTLLGEIGGGIFIKVLAIFGISLAIITTNIAANIVAPANALVNLSPSIFTFRTGALVTMVLGIAFQPWRLMQSSETYVYTWLVGYSALLGPIGAIILVDYYLIRHMFLDVTALYSVSPLGAYYYCGGVNLAAIAALVIAIAPVIPGFLNNVGILKETTDAFVVIYNNAWLITFFSAGIVFWLISYLTRNRETPSLEPLLPDSLG